MTLRHLPQTLLLILLLFVTVWTTAGFFPLAVFTPALNALLASMPAERVIRRYLPEKEPEGEELVTLSAPLIRRQTGGDTIPGVPARFFHCPSAPVAGSERTAPTLAASWAWPAWVRCMWSTRFSSQPSPSRKRAPSLAASRR